jgi:cytochrome c biogenesis protein CcdA
VSGRFGLAFTAGMLATVNPCGFAMLPAYLAWFLGVDAPRRPVGDGQAAEPDQAGVVRAIGVGAVVSLGFMAVFISIGSVLSWLGVEAAEISPWITIPIGIGLVVAGIAMLRGLEPRLPLPRLDRGGRERTNGSMFLFGVSYAIASVSCTAPVFLSQASSGFGRSFATGMTVYVVYGLGMATVLIAVTVAVAQARHAVLLRMKELLRYVNRVAGALLVVTGAYVAYYGWYELRVLDGGDVGDPIIDTAFHIQGWVSDGVEQLGITALATVFAAVLLIALVAVWRFRTTRSRTPTTRSPQRPTD